jgi:tRNA(Arg) A34 adenosine deaminase TadA
MSVRLRPYDEKLLRQAFDVARRSREAGDHPFGSVLADGEGKLLMEQGNGFTSEGRDRTAHAERLLASRAARAYDLGFLSRCTLYTSAEPCAMCAGAIYWAGIGRVVYGQTEKGLKAQTGAHEENPTLALLWHFLFERSADLPAAVRASVGWSARQGCDDGFSYGRQRWLRRPSGDSFFPRSRRRGDDAGGRRMRSWP